MNKSLLVIIFLVSSIGMAAQSTLSGTLKDKEGLPLNHASLCLMKGNQIVLATNADSTGFFSLRPPDDKRYDLRISWNGNTVTIPKARQEDIDQLVWDGYIILQTEIIRQKIPADSK